MDQYDSYFESSLHTDHDYHISSLQHSPDPLQQPSAGLAQQTILASEDGNVMSLVRQKPAYHGYKDVFMADGHSPLDDGWPEGDYEDLPGAFSVMAHAPAYPFDHAAVILPPESDARAGAEYVLSSPIAASLKLHQDQMVDRKEIDRKASCFAYDNAPLLSTPVNSLTIDPSDSLTIKAEYQASFSTSPSSLMTDTDASFASSPEVHTPANPVHDWCYDTDNAVVLPQGLPNVPVLFSQPLSQSKAPPGHDDFMSDDSSDIKMGPLATATMSTRNLVKFERKASKKHAISRVGYDQVHALRDTACGLPTKVSTRTFSRDVKSRPRAIGASGGKRFPCRVQHLQKEVGGTERLMDCNKSFQREEHCKRHETTAREKEVCDFPDRHPEHTVYECPCCLHMFGGERRRNSRKDNFIDHVTKHVRAWVLKTYPHLNETIFKASKKSYKEKPVSPAQLLDLIHRFGFVHQRGIAQPRRSRGAAAVVEVEDPVDYISKILHRLKFKDLPGVSQTLYDFPGYENHKVLRQRSQAGGSPRSRSRR